MDPPHANAGHRGNRMTNEKLLEEVKYIKNDIDSIDKSITNINTLWNKHLGDVNRKSDSAEKIDGCFSEILSSYKTVVKRLKALEGEAGKHEQIGACKSKLTETKSRLDRCYSEYKEKEKKETTRQCEILFSGISAQGIDEIVQNGVPVSQIFEMALEGPSDKRLAAEATISNVKFRHVQLQQIEKQIEQIAELMKTLESRTTQQEDTVEQTHQNVAETTKDLRAGNGALDDAKDKIRGTRKKKWICLGICVVIIIAIIIIILVYIFVIRGTTGNSQSRKRELQM